MPKKYTYDIKFKIGKNKYVEVHDIKFEEIVTELQLLIDNYYNGMMDVNRNLVHNILYHDKGNRVLKPLCVLTKRPFIREKNPKSVSLQFRKQKAVVSELTTLSVEAV